MPIDALIRKQMAVVAQQRAELGRDDIDPVERQIIRNNLRHAEQRLERRIALRPSHVLV